MQPFYVVTAGLQIHVCFIQIVPLKLNYLKTFIFGPGSVAFWPGRDLTAPRPSFRFFRRGCAPIYIGPVETKPSSAPSRVSSPTPWEPFSANTAVSVVKISHSAAAHDKRVQIQDGVERQDGECQNCQLSRSLLTNGSTSFSVRCLLDYRHSNAFQILITVFRILLIKPVHRLRRG